MPLRRVGDFVRKVTGWHNRLDDADPKMASKGQKEMREKIEKDIEKVTNKLEETSAALKEPIRRPNNEILLLASNQERLQQKLTDLETLSRQLAEYTRFWHLWRMMSVQDTDYSILNMKEYWMEACEREEARQEMRRRSNLPRAPSPAAKDTPDYLSTEHMTSKGRSLAERKMFKKFFEKAEAQHGGGFITKNAADLKNRALEKFDETFEIVYGPDSIAARSLSKEPFFPRSRRQVFEMHG